MLSIGFCDYIEKSQISHTTVFYVQLESVIIIIRLMLSVWTCPKVITLSSLHCSTVTLWVSRGRIFGTWCWAEDRSRRKKDVMVGGFFVRYNRVGAFAFLCRKSFMLFDFGNGASSSSNTENHKIIILLILLILWRLKIFT